MLVAERLLHSLVLRATEASRSHAVAQGCLPRKRARSGWTESGLGYAPFGTRSPTALAFLPKIALKRSSRCERCERISRLGRSKCGLAWGSSIRGARRVRPTG